MNNLSLRILPLIALFAAIAFLLSFFDFNIPIFPVFLKLDFADLPALILTFVCGPAAGILVQLIRNALHLFISSTGGVGELANALVGCTLVGTAGYVYLRRPQGSRRLAIPLFTGTVSMPIIALLANYYLLLPLFSLFLPLDEIFRMSSRFLPFIHDIPTFLLFVILPFNLLKGLLISLLFYYLYGKLRPFLQHHQTFRF